MKGKEAVQEVREIKFRAWDTKNKEMTYFDLLSENTNCTFESGYLYIKFDSAFVNITSRDIKLMQFTGLKDKNSKEIYEGDIITWLDPFGHKPAVEVMYDESVACFNTHQGEVAHFSIRPQLEVIGNIFETPELLKEAEK